MRQDKYKKNIPLPPLPQVKLEPSTQLQITIYMHV